MGPLNNVRVHPLLHSILNIYFILFTFLYILKVPGGVRHSSLIMKPTHRRHLSEGSRVSFNDQPISEINHISHHTHTHPEVQNSRIIYLFVPFDRFSHIIN